MKHRGLAETGVNQVHFDAMLHALLLQGGRQTGTKVAIGGLAASVAQLDSMVSDTVLAASFIPVLQQIFKEPTHLVAGCSSRRGDTRAAAASSQRPVSSPQRVMAVRKPAAAVTTALLRIRQRLEWTDISYRSAAFASSCSSTRKSCSSVQLHLHPALAGQPAPAMHLHPQPTCWVLARPQTYPYTFQQGIITMYNGFTDA